MHLLKAARALQGRINFHGLDISVENRMGSIRQWRDPHAGKDGMTRMQRPYGYIKGTLGTDGDHVDVYVGPWRDAPNAYIVNQMKAPDFTEYDEQKVLLGFRSKREAVKFYRRHYDDHRFLGSVLTMTLDEFKEKVMQTRQNGGKPLEKAHVKAHTRREKSGAITQVKDYDDSRTKKKPLPKANPEPHSEPQSDQHKVEQFIPLVKVGYLKEKVEELNRKAKKLGLPEITFTRTGEQKVIKQEVQIGSGRDTRFKDVPVKCEKVIIRGESPRLNGWKVMAAITHMKAGNIVKNVGYDGDMPKKWRTAAPNCDHCNSIRDRNDTYIVTKGKETKQVGKTCLKDFTGHKSPEQMAAYASSIQDLFDEARDPDGFKMGGVVIAYPVKQILALAVDTIKKYGFVSRKMVQEGKGEFTTADGVIHRLFDRDDKEREITPEASKEAKALVDWLEGDFAQKKVKSDFEYNLHTFVSAGSLDGKAVSKATAFLAAAYPAYLREKGRLAEKKAAGEPKPSHAVGSIGERYSFNLTLKDIRNISGAYGNTSLYKYEDKDGNRFAYFASKPIHATEDIGKQFQLAATVKDHKEFNGQIETQLTRGTIGGKAQSAEGVKGSRENLEALNEMFKRTAEGQKWAKEMAKEYVGKDYHKQYKYLQADGSEGPMTKDTPVGEEMLRHIANRQWPGTKTFMSLDQTRSVEAYTPEAQRYKAAAHHIDDAFTIRTPETQKLAGVVGSMTAAQVAELTHVVANTMQAVPQKGGDSYRHRIDDTALAYMMAGYDSRIGGGGSSLGHTYIPSNTYRRARMLGQDIGLVTGHGERAPYDHVTRAREHLQQHPEVLKQFQQEFDNYIRPLNDNEHASFTMPNYKPATRFSNNSTANRPYYTALLRLAESIVGGKKIKKSMPLAKSAEAMCKQIGDSLGVNWKEVDLDEFCDGMLVELEHTDITGGDPVQTAKIVLAHLKERPDYYSRLKKYVEKAQSGAYLIRRKK